MYWMFLPLRRYAQFSGRSSRMEYWMFTLGLFILYIVFVAVVIAMAGLRLSGDGESDGLGFERYSGGQLVIIGLLASMILLTIIPSIAVSVRRLHDINLSGHWLWLAWLPNLFAGLVEDVSPFLSGAVDIISMLAWLAIIILAMFEGTPGSNRFGEDPRDGGVGAVFA